MEQFRVELNFCMICKYSFRSLDAKVQKIKKKCNLSVKLTVIVQVLRSLKLDGVLQTIDKSSSVNTGVLYFKNYVLLVIPYLGKLNSSFSIRRHN